MPFPITPKDSTLRRRTHSNLTTKALALGVITRKVWHPVSGLSLLTKPYAI